MVAVVPGRTASRPNRSKFNFLFSAGGLFAAGFFLGSTLPGDPPECNCKALANRRIGLE
jgi:hypothetical protein